MPERRTCSECHTPLPSDAPEGFCPACSLEGALRLGGLFSEAGVTRFGDYELLEEIARGGMGVVYRARQVSLDRIVAVKLILFGQFANEVVVKRFRAEATSTARLQHPNIVALHEVGEQGGQHFFSMDYVAGRNLADLTRDGPLPAKRAARLLKTVAEAIHYAHTQGIVHRDLKPSNILIDELGEPRITDFGLAKNLKSDSDLTLSGQLIGSPNFIAPEQAAGKTDAVGPHSDVYSLGAVLYHMLTGRPPFGGETLTETLNQVLTSDPPAPRLLKPSVPRDLETICLKCLEKEPHKRYATAQALADEINRFLGDEPITARPITRAEKVWRWSRRKPALAAAYGLLILLFLVILIGSPLAAYRINRERQRAETEATARRGQLYAAEVNLAQEALAEANLSRARELLNRQRPRPGETNDLRGFEWRYVYGQCRSDELLTLSRSKSPATAVRFAPNGQWLAVTDGDGNVRLWDHRTRREIADLPAYTNFIVESHPYDRKGMAISPDATRLAVGVGNTIALWDLQTRVQTSVLGAHTNIVTFLVFSPDGRTLASASHDGTARLWNVAANPPKPLAVLHGEFPALSLAFSDDGNLLALGVRHRVIRLWDVSTVAEPRELPPLEAPGGWGHALAFAPKTHLLASAGAGIVLWNLGAGGQLISTNPLRSERGSVGVVDFLAFSPDGQMLVSAGSDRNLTLWDLSKNGREPVKLKGHEAEILSVAFSSDGHLLTSGGLDGAVKLWDVSAPWPATPKMRHGDWIYQVAFSPDSRFLASVAQTPNLKLWDVATEQLVAQRNLTRGRGDAGLAFSPAGTLLALDDFGTVRLLEVPSLVEVTNFPGEWPCFSPTGAELIYLRERNVHQRNLQTHAEQIWKTDWSSVWSTTVSPDGRRIAASGGVRRNELRVWNLDAPDQPIELEKHLDEVISLSFSRDSRWLASASWEGVNRLWDLRNPHEPVASLAAHNGSAWTVAFSVDGRTLATGGDDSTIRLWHLASFQPAATLRGHKGTVATLAFSPDGKHLASGSGDGTVRIWRAPTLEEIAAAESAGKGTVP